MRVFRSKKFFIILGIILLVFIFAPKEKKSAPPVGNIPLSARGYDIGIGYQVGSRTPSFSLDKAYDKVKEVGEIAYIQGHWNEWISSHNYFADDVSTARSKGLKIYAALDILGYTPNTRQNVEIAPSLRISGDFTNQQVRDKYIELVKTISEKHKPEYFVVLVEANLHKKSNPSSYQAFINFYPEVYQEIKKLSPVTQVAVSNVYADLIDPSGFDQSDKNRFGQDIKDTDASSDLLAVSTYPLFLYQKPGSVPEHFLSEMSRHSSHPLFISETSWVSQKFSIPLFGPIPFTFETNQQDQADYVVRLAQSAQNLKKEGKEISAINFVTLIDVPEASCNAIKAQAPTLEWFCYLGLLEPSGNEKPAFGKLKELKN